MAKAKKLPFSLQNGMWSGGDAAQLPDGYARKCRNVVRANGPWVARPQFTYDSLTSAKSLGLWHDEDTDSYRLIAITNAGGAFGTNNLYVRDAAAASWTSEGVVNGAFLGLDGYNNLPHANYRGTVYFSVGTSDALAFAHSYADGVRSDYIISGCTENHILPLTYATFKERLFFGGANLSVENLIHSAAYDPTAWTLSNLTGEEVTQTGVSTIGRVTPSAASGVQMSKSVALGVGGDAFYTWLCHLRGTDPSYSLPVQLEAYLRRDWVDATDYDVGDCVTDGDYIYRCTVAGTSGAVEPTWTTTVGATYTDNTVTWINDGSNIIGTSKVYVPGTNVTRDFQTYSVSARTPAGRVNADLYVRLKYGHDGGSFTRVALDMSLRDNNADGTLAKQNYGQQVTKGSFFFPFYNQEDSDTATVSQSEYVYWSEVGTPNKVSAANYYRLREVPGAITAIRSVGAKLVVFKRTAAWTFGTTNDPDNPILPEGEARVGYGCLGHRALGVFEDYVYFIGEDEIYRMRVGDDPEPLCGESMRDEIMSKSSTTWCESQSTPANRALLTIDFKNRRLWVYTQRGTLYCKDIDAPAGAGWSKHDAGGDTSATATGYQVCDMIYNPTTREVFVAFAAAATGTAGVARLDPTQTGAQDQIGTGAALPVYKEIWLRPIELESREDLVLDQLDVHHKITASQTDQTLTASYSFDQGTTFTTFETLTVSPVSAGEYDPLQIPYYQTGDSIMPRILHSGKGGAENFNVSRLIASVRLMTEGGAFPKETA